MCKWINTNKPQTHEQIYWILTGSLYGTTLQFLGVSSLSQELAKYDLEYLTLIKEKTYKWTEKEQYLQQPLSLVQTPLTYLASSKGKQGFL